MKKILVCDDSDTVLTLFEKKLRLFDFEIIGKAKDGIEGFKLYQQLKPDLVLLDVTMPNEDGRDCLIKIINSDPVAKVIMVSAVKDENVSKTCLKNGAKAFISKGHLYLDSDFKNEVVAVINKVLNG